MQYTLTFSNVVPKNREKVEKIIKDSNASSIGKPGKYEMFGGHAEISYVINKMWEKGF